MAQFEDMEGRSWSTGVTVATLRRVKAALGVDLLSLADESSRPEENLLYRLMSDPCVLCDVLYVVCKPDLDAAGVSDEQFGGALGGDCLAAAADALIEGIVDFFPDPRDRSRARRAIEAIKTVTQKAHDALDAALDPAAIAARTEAMVADLTAAGDRTGSGG